MSFLHVVYAYMYAYVKPDASSAFLVIQVDEVQVTDVAGVIFVHLL